jgi:hypothetical protein
MAVKTLIVMLGVAALALLGAASQTRAQQTTPTAAPGQSAPLVPQRVRRRIEINPRPLLYRRCVDWYELQYRPSGTVLYPQMHCWWVRG